MGRLSPGSATNSSGGGGSSTITSLLEITSKGQATGANSLPVVLPSDQTVPISVASLPLPSGAATAAKQDTIMGHLDGVEGILTTIDIDTGNISTKIDTLAGAVSGTEMQVDVLTMPAVTIQDGGNSITVDTASVTDLDLGAGTITRESRGLILSSFATTTTLADSAAYGDDQTAGLASVNARLWDGSQYVRSRGDATNGLDVDVTRIATALPAGTNAIGKLAANSGVDIGDVDVTSIIPGTGATNLGKAEDAAHITGDVGVMMLGVRNDNFTTLTSDEGDYSPFQLDQFGRLYTKAAAEGTVAHDDADSGNPVKIGGKAASSEPTAVTANDRVNAWFDLNGRQMVKAGHDQTGIAHGVTTVTTAGTDVALAGSTVCKRVVIQSQTDNTGLIAVGGSGVDATEATGTGIILYPGDSFEIMTDNLADIFIDSTVNGEGVRYTYFT